MTDLILCPGMARAGTTWLHSQLANAQNTHHFDFGKTKESEVFTGEQDHPWDWYYPDAGQGRASVDVSPYYLSHWSPWIDNILAHQFRSVKVILMLREPVEQLWSHYLHDIRAHISRRYMGDEVNFSLWKPETLYRYCAKRAGSVRRLISAFGRENVLAVNYHTDLEDLGALEGKLSNFLGFPLTGFSPVRENFNEGMPYFVFGAGGIETVIDDRPVHVPENTMLLVNGSRSAIWPNTWQPTAAKLMLTASMWTRGLSQGHIDRLSALFRQDWREICDTLSLDPADFPRPQPQGVAPARLSEEVHTELMLLNGVPPKPLEFYAFEMSSGETPAFAQVGAL